MLKTGYVLMMLAGAGAIGFVGHHVVRLVVVSAAIHPFFKAVILLAGLGVLLAVAGLIRERRREDRDATHNHGDG